MHISTILPMLKTNVLNTYFLSLKKSKCSQLYTIPVQYNCFNSQIIVFIMATNKSKRTPLIKLRH